MSRGRTLIGLLRGKSREALNAVTLLERSGLRRSLSARSLTAFALKAHRARFGPHLAPLFHALTDPQRLALIEGPRTRTYAELDCEVSQLGRALLDLGVVSGDRVAIMLPNCIEHLVAQIAIPRIGAIAAEIGSKLKAAEISFILADAQPTAIVCHRRFASEMDAAREGAKRAKILWVDDGGFPDRVYEFRGDRPPDRSPRGGATTPGFMVYTSGTTGRPKGATRDLEGVAMAAAVDMMSQVGMRSDDRNLVVCPLYHSAAPAFAAMMLALGGLSVLVDEFDELAVLRTIAEHRITGAFMVPTMLSRIAAVPAAERRAFDTSSLRWVCSGAAPLATATAAAFQEAFGYLLWNFYGATETGLVSLAGPFDHHSHPNTVGRALTGTEIRIADESGRELPPGRVGEIYVRSGMLIRGYHDDPDATAESMRDGFFSVGDLGTVDDEGYLYLASRKSDMIISGGVNIYPREIEICLLEHPDVIDVAVVGAPDPDWGECVRAFVVRRPDATVTESELVAHCRAGLADYKRPRQVHFVDELPRNPTGKVLKRRLRDA